MRLIGYSNVSNVRTWEDLRRYTANFFEKLPGILNGNIQFGDNIRSQGPFDFTISTGSEVVGISHTLGFVPAGYLLVYQTTSAVIYAADSNTYPWTKSTIYLTASAAVAGRVILF